MTEMWDYWAATAHPIHDDVPDNEETAALELVHVVGQQDCGAWGHGKK